MPTGPRRAIWFEAPCRAVVRSSPLPTPEPEEALVRTSCSAISTGTELAAWRGDLDPGMARDETLPGLRQGSFRFPFAYGYASVGRVLTAPAGEEVRAHDRVFAFVPHQSHFTAPPEALTLVPEAIPSERAALFPYLETAVNLTLDGRPRVGDRVAVVGQGVLGLTLTALLARFPLEGLAAVEPRKTRRDLAERWGADAVYRPEDAREAARSRFSGGFDLVFEVSGNRAALDLAIGMTAREGRVIAGSWLAGGPTSVDLSGWFHRGRISIVSSQVSRLPPLGPGWTVARRRRAAWSLLRSIPLEGLVSHRIPLAEAPAAYPMLARGEGLAVLLVPAAG